MRKTSILKGDPDSYSAVFILPFATLEVRFVPPVSPLCQNQLVLASFSHQRESEMRSQLPSPTRTSLLLCSRVEL